MKGKTRWLYVKVRVEQWDEKRWWMATSTSKFEWFEVFKKHFGKFWDALGGILYIWISLYKTGEIMFMPTPYELEGC